jgi:activator of HSP90 ATPase
MSDRIHQEVNIDTTPERIYRALTDGAAFTTFTSAEAEITGDAGGGISLFSGGITGRNIELLPNQRIVQAWRAKNWPPGVYSIVKFELVAQGAGTRVVLDQTGFPEGDREHLDHGWHRMYWDPLKKYLP